MVVPANSTGGGQNFGFVPLTDFFGNPVTVHFGGTNTFRCTCIGSSYEFNYLAFLCRIPTQPCA